MGPGGDGDLGRAHSEDEPFPQLMLLLQLTMLLQPMEFPILGMVGRKSPGSSILRGAPL